MEPVWRERFRVQFYDADPHGRVTLPALCRYLQVAADRHARTAGASMEALQSAGRMWVLTELSVAVDKFSCLDEHLTVETWGSSRMAGARAYRDFLLFNDKGERLGCACSLWLYLDAATRRPLRLPESILTFRVAHRDPVLPGTFEPICTPPVTIAEASVRVGWQDLDQNHHANNVRYLEWALDPVPDPVWTAYRPCAVTLRFQNEGRLGDVLSSGLEMVETEAGLRMEHRLHNQNNGTVATVSTRWMPAL